MKFFARVFFLVLLSFGFIQSYAQQKHFIYIESENSQPFALVMNGKVYSSSDYGYVIVPKLDDGTYNFTISFPLNKFPDQNFKCVIDKKDAGYKLKNNADKTWALQNMQPGTESTTTASAATTPAPNTAGNNAFGNMLSDVVNDSTLTKKTVAAKQTDTVAAVPKVDTATTAPTTETTSNNNFSTVADSANVLQKISETKQDTGTDMVFVDKASGGDTIHAFVPSSETANDNVSSKPAVDATNIQPQINNTDTSTKTPAHENTSSNITASSSAAVDTSLHAASNPFYKSNNQDNSNANQQNSSATNTNNAADNSGTVKPSGAVRNDCNNMVSDNDLDKVKRKMFVQNNDNSMVQIAIKYLGKKCITTDQVKMLGSIFSSDDGRYNLYDALYKQTYDYGNYANLENQIIDPYYKKRFEAMLK